MALVVCIECKKEISDKAETCPHCGARIAPGGSGAATATAACWTPQMATGRARGNAWRIVRYVLIVVVLAAGWWIWQATTSNQRAPFSAGLSGAFRESRTVVDERQTLKAGQHLAYDLALQTDSRVHVRVTAMAAPVDMMLMSKQDGRQFLNAGGELFGGGYAGHAAFSEAQVGMMDKTEVVKKGDWTLVVMRPKGGATSPESAGVEIGLTVY